MESESDGDVNGGDGRPRALNFQAEPHEPSSRSRNSLTINTPSPTRIWRGCIFGPVPHKRIASARSRSDAPLAKTNRRAWQSVRSLTSSDIPSASSPKLSGPSWRAHATILRPRGISSSIVGVRRPNGPEESGLERSTGWSPMTKSGSFSATARNVHRIFESSSAIVSTIRSAPTRTKSRLGFAFHFPSRIDWKARSISGCDTPLLSSLRETRSRNSGLKFAMRSNIS